MFAVMLNCVVRADGEMVAMPVIMRMAQRRAVVTGTVCYLGQASDYEEARQLAKDEAFRLGLRLERFIS